MFDLGGQAGILSEVSRALEFDAFVARVLSKPLLGHPVGVQHSKTCIPAGTFKVFNIRLQAELCAGPHSGPNTKAERGLKVFGVCGIRKVSTKSCSNVHKGVLLRMSWYPMCACVLLSMGSRPKD